MSLARVIRFMPDLITHLQDELADAKSDAKDNAGTYWARECEEYVRDLQEFVAIVNEMYDVARALESRVGSALNNIRKAPTLAEREVWGTVYEHLKSAARGITDKA